MFVDLKLSNTYDGLLYLADTTHNLWKIQSYRHNEIELNLALRGAINLRR